MATNYTAWGMVRAIVIATTIAGTLYSLAAFALAIEAGGSPLGVLRGIGGAVIDPETLPNPYLAPLIGLGLHFSIMTVMATIYVLAASRIRLVNRSAVFSGIGYGIVLWGVMSWVVLPWRWPTMFPIGDSQEIAIQLFCHIVLVGIPIARVTRSARQWS